MSPRRKPPFQGSDDLLDLLESLPRIRVGADGYSETDRASDFIGVFSSEQGRRVLTQIGQICDRPSPLAEADRHGALAFKAGSRWVMHEIQRCFVVRQPVITERNADE